MCSRTAISNAANSCWSEQRNHRRSAKPNGGGPLGSRVGGQGRGIGAAFSRGRHDRWEAGRKAIKLLMAFHPLRFLQRLLELGHHPFWIDRVWPVIDEPSPGAGKRELHERSSLPGGASLGCTQPALPSTTPTTPHDPAIEPERSGSSSCRSSTNCSQRTCSSWEAGSSLLTPFMAGHGVALVAGIGMKRD